jgi:hypothetical protein
MLTRTSFDVPGFDRCTFECSVCELVALGDPMKSEKTGRWFHGELRAPT